MSQNSEMGNTYFESVLANLFNKMIYFFNNHRLQSNLEFCYIGRIKQTKNDFTQLFMELQ
jgi:hypothetical protein